MQAISKSAVLKMPPLYQDMAVRLASAHVGRQDEGGVDALKERLEAEGDGRIRTINLPWPQLNRSVGYGLLNDNTSLLGGAGGVSKSLWNLNVMLHAGGQGFKWKLLPLEDSADRWVMRALAVRMGDWSVIGNPKTDSAEERRRVADRKLALVEMNRDFVESLYENILQNPWLPIEDSAGVNTVRPVRYTDILHFLEDAAEDCDLICLDPISQIQFSEDGRDYRGQEDFARQLSAIAASTQTHFLLICHTTKNFNPVSGDPLSCFQGSAMLGRLAHNAFLLQRNDPAVESDLFASDQAAVEHRLTLTVVKSRSGMSGDKIAMDFAETGPQFREYGLIRPQVRRAKG